MEQNTEKMLSAGRKIYRRPPFTMIDWIIAAISIALLVFILLNLPPV